MGLLSETQNATIRTGTDVVPSRPKWEPFRAPNGLELHPPFPKDIGTMCGLGKGAAPRLGPRAFILGHLVRHDTTAFSPARRVGFSELLGSMRLRILRGTRVIDPAPNQIVASHIPFTKVASVSPGHGGIATQMNFNSWSDTFRYWKAVPTGMSIAVPASRSVTVLATPWLRQISPCPCSTNQNSLTVAWTVARFV